jgi:uncharacterized damage-inducible protein DinB
MPIANQFLPEFDQEMTTTRKLIEISPDAKSAWKPHPKSMALGDLGLHLANIVQWATLTMKGTEFDLNPPGGPKWAPRKFESSAATVAQFDENVMKARAAIGEANDADFEVGWTLKDGGKPILTLPRLVCLRSFVMNHLIHHRGQLSVYLRLCDVKLPQVYGPTADTLA